MLFKALSTVPWNIVLSKKIQISSLQYIFVLKTVKLKKKKSKKSA